MKISEVRKVHEDPWNAICELPSNDIPTYSYCLLLLESSSTGEDCTQSDFYQHTKYHTMPHSWCLLARVAHLPLLLAVWVALWYLLRLWTVQEEAAQCSYQVDQAQVCVSVCVCCVFVCVCALERSLLAVHLGWSRLH